jgi:hypothetical protein
MAGRTHDEFARWPVDSLATFLTVCGREDPTLLCRPEACPAGDDHADAPRSLQCVTAALPEPHDATAEADHYLEELVSIAVASARRAEDAAEQALAARTTARRRLSPVIAFGVGGILTGLAAAVAMYIEVGSTIARSAASSTANVTQALPEHAAVQAAVRQTGNVTQALPEHTSIQAAVPQTADVTQVLPGHAAVQAAVPQPAAVLRQADVVPPQTSEVATAPDPSLQPAPLKLVSVRPLPLPPDASPVKASPRTRVQADGSGHAMPVPVRRRPAFAPITAFSGLFVGISQGIRTVLR